MATKEMLKLREKMKKRKPSFRRNEANKRFHLSRTGWRRPVGFHSKQRQYHKGKAVRVNIGYRVPIEVRGLHSSGKEFLYISNVADLEKADAGKHILIISAQIGTKKKIAIIAEANKRKLEVHNLEADKFEEKVKGDLAARKERRKVLKAKKSKKAKKEAEKKEKKAKATEKKSSEKEIKDDKSEKTKSASK